MTQPARQRKIGRQKVDRQKVGRRITGVTLLSAVLFLSLNGCNLASDRSKTSPSETKTLPADSAAKQQPSKPAAQDALPPGIAIRKVTFRQPDGTPEFSIQFKSTGAKLVDRSGKVIANVIAQSDGVIQLTDANNKTVGYVSQAEDSWQIESEKRSKALFTFRQARDGSAMLTRNDGSSVYTLKSTEQGYAVESGKGERYLVSTRKGNGQLQTGDGEVMMVTDGAIAPAALASFGFSRLTPAQQAGLAYALSQP